MRSGSGRVWFSSVWLGLAGIRLVLGEVSWPVGWVSHSVAQSAVPRLVMIAAPAAGPFNLLEAPFALPLAHCCEYKTNMFERGNHWQKKEEIEWNKGQQKLA